MDLPSYTSLGIGSLPHRDPREALALIAETTPVFPHWPQLPNRDPREGMIAQTLGPLAGLPETALSEAARCADAGLDLGRAAGWFAFRDGFHERFPAAQAVKGQLTGPLTLAHAVLERAPTPADDDVLAALTTWVARCARWQAQQLAALGLPALVVLDEPCLGLVDPPAHLLEHLGRIASAVHRVEGAAFGIHCCSPPPLQLLGELALDALAFDADQGLEAAAANPAARALHANGARFVWGLVPTTGGATVETLAARWTAAVASHPWVSERPLFSPACGLGTRDRGVTAGVLRVALKLAGWRATQPGADTPALSR